VLEVNPNPDLTEGVSFMESAERAGYEFEVALDQIVEMALARTPAPPEAPPEAVPPVLPDPSTPADPSPPPQG